MRSRLMLALGAALAASGGEAEGFFQVRGFLPSTSVTSAFTVDAAYTTTFGDSSLDFKLAGVSLDRQSASVTFVSGRLFALAQLDRSRTVLGGQGLLLGVVQGTFDGTLLQSLGLTVTNASGDGAGYGYATTSADVNASGRFSDTVSWSASAGGSLTDAGSTNTTDVRLRGEVKAQLTPDLQLGGGVGASRTDTTGEGLSPFESSRLFAFANASVALTPTEKLSGSGQFDFAGTSQGAYGVDASIESTRFDPWALSARGGLTKDGTSYGLAVSRTPDPFGLRLGVSGALGSSSSHNLDAEGQYQQGSFGAQFGGGLGFGPNFELTSRRVSAGVSSSGGDLAGQVRATVSFGAATTGSLSGRVSWNASPVRLDLGAALNLSSAGLTGETDAQVLYQLSDTIDLNASVRFRPNTASPVQGGFGLRLRF